MSFSSRSYANRYIPSSRFPTGVKWLLVVTALVSLIELLLRGRWGALLFQLFALVPAQFVRSFAVWEIVTYLFLHAGIYHLLWNLLALWMFGAELERTWGTKRFLRFYFLCGIIAGLTVVIVAYLFGTANVPMVGSSGAVYGILAAYAVLFPNQTMLFGFLIPIKTKYFVLIIAAVLLYFTIASGLGAIDAVASLSGMVAAYLLLRGKTLRTRVRQPVVAGYQDWKLRRAKRKFEVYLRKRDSDRDRWVH